MQWKEAQKQADIRKREKREDLIARQRVKEQIARDRADKKAQQEREKAESQQTSSNTSLAKSPSTSTAVEHTHARLQVGDYYFEQNVTNIQCNYCNACSLNYQSRLHLQFVVGAHLHNLFLFPNSCYIVTIFYSDIPSYPHYCLFTNARYFTNRRLV